MSELESTVFAFDAANDFEGLQTFYLNSEAPTQDFVAIIWALLNKSRFRGSYLLAKLLYLRGIVSPLVSVALYFGATEVGNSEDEELARGLLRRQFDEKTPEQREGARETLEPIIMNELSAALMEPDLTPRMMRMLKALREIFPELRAMFDLDAPYVPLDLEAVREKGRAKAKLLPFALPPAGAPRAPRRALVAIRELFFPHFVNSRKFEFGPVLMNAMTAYGWDASFIGMQFHHREIEDCRRIVETCVRENADVLVLDAVITHFPECAELLTELKAKMPELKIVGIYLDAWPIKAKQLKSSGVFFDLVWSMSPDLEAWEEADLTPKTFVAPFVRGGDYGGPILPLQQKTAFIGGVAGYNWHRGLWIAATRAERLPIECHMTEFKTDGLSAVESYLVYMRRLADSRCSVNFSMRSTMIFIVTGRTFEILATGALLINERAPEMDRYLIEGEHYLPFSTFSELRAAIKFVEESPREAEQMRRRGNAFFRERYHDDKIIGYLDRRLFWPA